MAALMVVLFVVFAKPEGTNVLSSKGDRGLELRATIGTFTDVHVTDGKLEIRLGEMRAPLAPGSWVMQLQPGADILVEGDVRVGETSYRTGDRLTVDKEQRLGRQRWHRRIWNATKYYAWRFRHALAGGDA